MDWWRVRQVANAVNGSTLLGLGIARVGRSRLRRGPRGLLLASGYRLPFPNAGAFTVGDVVVTRHDPSWWTTRARVLAHEERHSWQWAVSAGLPFLPAYGAAAAWAFARGRDWSTYNVFERLAGLADGGYPTLSLRERRRRPGRAA